MVLDQVGPTAAKLRLPTEYKMHPVFHVSLLRPCKFRPDVDPASLPLDYCDQLPDAIVKKVLAVQVVKGCRGFWVSWVGKSKLHDSWEHVSVVPEDLKHDFLLSIVDSGEDD